MKRTVQLTRRAKREVREIIAWYEERSGSSDVANKWAAGFFDLFDRIEQEPFQHPQAREADDLGEDIREVHYWIIQPGMAGYIVASTPAAFEQPGCCNPSTQLG